MKKILFLASLLAWPGIAALLSAQGTPAAIPTQPTLKQYVISDMGAVGDGMTVNTKAIQAAIDQCAANGGGVIVVPAGTFLSGALFFKQGVNLRVDKDAVLKSTTATADFPAIYTRWEGIERYWTCAFLNFVGMKDVDVSGEGEIDGSGTTWGTGGGRGARGAGGAAAAGAGLGGTGAFAGRGAAAPAPSPELTAINSALRNALSADPEANSILNKYPNFQLIQADPAAPAPATRGAAAQYNTPAPDPAQFYTLPYPTTATINLAADRSNLPPVNAAGVRVPGGGLAPPRSLVFQNCENVHVSGLYLHNEARWGYVFIYCKNVVAENLTAFTDTRIASSDGMDIDSCNHVRVTNCSFDDGDDDISIKSGKDEDGRRVNIPCEDILIEKCHFGRGDGGAAMGSETSGGIRNVTVRDCIADNGNAAPVRIKTNFTRGGVIENITYENITFNDVQRCYEINLNWTATSSAGPRMPPVLRNVKIINCSGLGDSAGYIYGLYDSQISNVTFDNCHVTTYTGITIADVTNDVVASVQGPGLKVDSEDGQPIILRGNTPPPANANANAAVPAAATN
ncbi:MAG TPA: glycosyl hydrolase family 28 protein [Opitutales bacterium]|jgi:polygalacturonase|nr:glycosyl hydrolase family 28 protein [Opitutales bacterium]